MLNLSVYILPLLICVLPRLNAMQKPNFQWYKMNVVWWLISPSDIFYPPQMHLRQGKEDGDVFDNERQGKGEKGHIKGKG